MKQRRWSELQEIADPGSSKGSIVRWPSDIIKHPIGQKEHTLIHALALVVAELIQIQEDKDLEDAKELRREKYGDDY